MKAILHTKYGSADELQLEEIEKPVPKDNEVLIKIHASTVTSSDCNVRNLTFVTKGFWLPSRIFFGLFKPKINILGFDLSGEIEAIGKDVKRFKKGDEVFGTPGIAFGAHAEYTCMPEDGVLAIKPSNLTWEEAAAIFLAAHTAYFYLKDLGNIQAGQEILINGASGAIGTYAIQLANYFGAEVTGVCSTTNLEMVKRLGANTTLDYTKEDFTKNGKLYDIIFDAAGKHTTFSHCKRSLKKNGIFLPVSMNLIDVAQMIWTSIKNGKKVKGGPACERVEDLIFFKKLLEEGKLSPVIDKIFPLEQIVEAFKYVERGHKKGNVVITMRHGTKIW